MGGGGGGGHFARGKLEFKLFLNDLWYEPETFLTFTRDYLAEKKIDNIIKFSFQGVTCFFIGG